MLAKDYDLFNGFLSEFNHFTVKELYETLVAVTFFFEVTNHMIESTYTKKLHLVFLDVVNIENHDRFVRQFKAILNKEKIITTKDKIVERVEHFIKGVSRFILIGELPNLIKKGTQAQEEYMKLRNVLDVMVKIKK